MSNTKAADVKALPAIETVVDISPVSQATWIEWINRVPHVMLAAETGGGKTTTALHLLAPRIAASEQYIIIDPHASGWGGLPSIGGGENWHQIRDAMGALIELYQNRQHDRASYLSEHASELPHDHFGRLTIILDEAYLIRQALDTGKDSVWRQFVPMLGSGARKVGMSVILLTQTANVEDIGLSGPLRENYTRIALDSSSARKLVIAEEPNKERRSALLNLLAGMDRPAVTERNGQVEILDRQGMQSTPSFLRDSVHLAWQYTPRAISEPSIVAAIRDAKQAGLTREEARSEGLRFDNDLWASV